MQLRPGAGLILFLLLGACARGEDSPFDLWDLRVGMQVSELDSIAQAHRNPAFECSSGPESFRTCHARTTGASGLMEAIVGADGRTIRLTFTPDLDAMHGASEPAGLVLATESLREGWSAVVDANANRDAAVRTERWSTRDGRWSARIVWDGNIVHPAKISVTDEHALREFELAQHRFEAAQLARAAAAPPEIQQRRADPELLVELMKIELRQLVSAQKVYHEFRKDYETDLAALQYQPRPRITVDVGAANALGFWARATHADIEQTCLVWFGRVPRPPAGLGPVEGEPVCVPEL